MFPFPLISPSTPSNLALTIHSLSVLHVFSRSNTLSSLLSTPTSASSASSPLLSHHTHSSDTRRRSFSSPLLALSSRLNFPQDLFLQLPFKHLSDHVFFFTLRDEPAISPTHNAPVHVRTASCTSKYTLRHFKGCRLSHTKTKARSIKS